ncbi:MAG: Rieske 2Fe-2S domain-containing protein, partial [Deltaproteobacteria bacterium]|nr:Rieske 2Fe-2S domain-containing protein [Deltaproteobacteria bacterium]
RVGPGTAAGEMHRRYWHPIGFAKELKGRPKRKRLLGEDLVLFRDEHGKLGLLGLRCPHRATSLEYGHIEDGGLRCCYHGWLFDVNGQCLEQPAEPAQRNFKDRVRHLAYKVEELNGIIFAYLGPEPAPLLPRYDVLVRDDSVRSIWGRVMNCNYFQMVENTVDQHHFRWLHRTPTSKFWQDIDLKSELTEFGIRDHFTRRAGKEKYTTVSYFIMPTLNKTGYHVDPSHPAGIVAGHVGYEALRWRVPVDDTHTLHVTVAFAPVVDGKPTGKLPPDRQEEILEVPPGAYKWDDETGWIARNDQDRCAQESQGLICDRTAEHLGYSDKGVILLRELYRKSIDAARNGQDPLGILRDPSKSRIVEIIPSELPST